MMNQIEGQPTLRHWGVLILLTLVWGTSFILIKKGLNSFSGMQVGALRITIAFLCFIPVAWPALLRIPRKILWYLLVIGIFSSFIPSFLIPIGQQETDSSTAGILVSLTPLSTYIWGISLFRQEASVRRTLGVMTGLVGASILVMDPNTPMGFNVSAIYILASSIMYGLSGNIVHRHLKHIDSTDITAVSFVLIGLPALVYLLTTDFVFIMQTDNQAWWSLGAVTLLAIVGTAMALLLYWKLVQQTDPVFGSTTTYLVPVIAILWGLADGERLFTHQFFGFALILMSVFLVRSKNSEAQ